MNRCLFLYGTLLPGEAPQEIASVVKQFRRLGAGQVRGRLYDFGAFPGAILDPTSRSMIHGELVVLPSDDQTLHALDRYEEFDPSDPERSLFVRQEATIQMANGTTRKGWIYVYNRKPGKAKLIRGGDYTRSKVA